MLSSRYFTCTLCLKKFTLFIFEPNRSDVDRFLIIFGNITAEKIFNQTILQIRKTREILMLSMLLLRLAIQSVSCSFLQEVPAVSNLIYSEIPYFFSITFKNIQIFSSKFDFRR